MRRVVGYARRRPPRAVRQSTKEQSKWRHSLMNFGARSAEGRLNERRRPSRKSPASPARPRRASCRRTSHRRSVPLRGRADKRHMALMPWDSHCVLYAGWQLRLRRQRARRDPSFAACGLTGCATYAIESTRARLGPLAEQTSARSERLDAVSPATAARPARAQVAIECRSHAKGALMGRRARALSSHGKQQRDSLAILRLDAREPASGASRPLSCT
jgi:hypothetical protein